MIKVIIIMHRTKNKIHKDKDELRLASECEASGREGEYKNKAIHRLHITGKNKKQLVGENN